MLVTLLVLAPFLHNDYSLLHLSSQSFVKDTHTLALSPQLDRSYGIRTVQTILQ